jgi:hypothetical protein
MKSQHVIALILAATLSFTISLVLAEDKPDSKTKSSEDARQGSRPCEEEIKQLCPDIKPGEGRIAECVRQHGKELSPQCQKKHEELERHKQAREHAQKACHDDVQKFCKDVDPGEGRIVRCLEEHEKSLSERCRTTLDRKESKRDERRRRGHDESGGSQPDEDDGKRN